MAKRTGRFALDPREIGDIKTDPSPAETAALIDRELFKEAMAFQKKGMSRPLLNLVG